ncbi:DsbA family protein [Streptomyces hokutonensis]|uniref:DsbA family oxidoreductase n=1 Tax=Streptomyces hokutonensis TaxID=1306990 RepID=UPI003825201C
MRVEIWSDVVCPWCYIADARFEKALTDFSHRDQVEVVYRSFELDPGHDGTHVEPVPSFLQRRFGPQGPAMDEQVAGRARREGLDYRTDRKVGSTLDAHRLLHWAKTQGRQRQLVDLLFETNFAKAQSIFTRDALAELAGRAGLDSEQARRVLDDSDAFLGAVRTDERAAGDLGAQGVPFFVFDGRDTLSGAQPVSAFRGALEAAWQEHVADDLAEGAVCTPDEACAVPSHSQES